MLSYTYIVGLPCAYLFVILNLLQAESALWGSLKWSLGSSAVLAGFLLYAARFFESHTSNRDVDVRHLPVYRLPLYTLHAVAAAIPLGEGASIVALICLWCTHIFRYRPQLRWGALGLYFSLYGLGLILGFVGAGKINCGWSAVSHVLPFSLLLWGRFYGAFYTQKHIERCLGFFLASYSVALLFGFFCFLTNTRPFEDWIHAVANSHGQSLIPYTSYTAPTGFYFHRLIMSHVGLITICGIVGYILGHRTLRFGFYALFAYVTLFLTVLTILICQTRAALWSLIPMLVYAFWHLQRNITWSRLAMLTSLVGFCVTLAPQISARFSAIHPQRIAEDRALPLIYAGQLIRDYPWGVGWHNYTFFSEVYYRFAPSDLIRTYPHHLSLSVLAEGGVLSLGAWWAIFIFLLRRPLPKSIASLGLAGRFSIIAMWITSLSHDFFYHTPVAYTFWGLWALILSRY